MRSVRRALLLTVMTTAALAIAASSASALSVVREPSLQPCPAVTNVTHGTGAGGCLIRAVSEAPVELGSPLGMVLCNNTFEARVNSAGVGYIYTKSLTNCTPLTLIPCVEPGLGEGVWPVRVTAENRMEAQFCVQLGPGGPQLRCHLNNININEAPGTPMHRYEFITNLPPNHSFCE